MADANRFPADTPDGDDEFANRRDYPDRTLPPRQRRRGSEAIGVPRALGLQSVLGASEAAGDDHYVIGPSAEAIAAVPDLPPEQLAEELAGLRAYLAENAEDSGPTALQA